MTDNIDLWGIFVGLMAIGMAVMFVGSVTFMMIAMVKSLFEKPGGKISAREHQEFIRRANTDINYSIRDMEETVRRNRLDDLAKPDHYAGGNR